MLIRLGLLRKAILGIPPEAATNEFTPSADEATDAARQLERVATTFLFAYNATLEKPELSYARFVRDSIDREYRGFAVEGIGMALAVAKLTNPFARVNRGIEFGDELGGRRRILAYVGVGWAYAMLRRSFTNDLSLLHPSSREMGVRWPRILRDAVASEEGCDSAMAAAPHHPGATKVVRSRLGKSAMVPVSRQRGGCRGVCPGVHFRTST